MQCSPVFKGAYDAVYNNCQSFVIMLVNEILRDKDTVRAQGFTEIMPLTRCYYEHLRNVATHLYFKEIPQVFKAYPKIVREKYEYLFSHPIECSEVIFNPMRRLRFYKSELVRLTREGSSRRKLYILPEELAGPIAQFIMEEQGEQHDDSQRVD